MAFVGAGATKAAVEALRLVVLVAGGKLEAGPTAKDLLLVDILSQFTEIFNFLSPLGLFFEPIDVRYEFLKSCECTVVTYN